MKTPSPKNRSLRGFLLGCLLGCAVSMIPGKLFGSPAAAIERLQSEDDPEPGQDPLMPEHMPGEIPGEPKSPSEEPFTPAPYFPEVPQFLPDEPPIP